MKNKLLPLLAPKYWPFWLIIGMLRCAILLPYKVQLSIGRRLGRVLKLFGGKSVRTARINLNLCFPHLTIEERQQLLDKNFESIGISVFETAMGWWASTKKLRSIPMYVKGYEHVEKAVQQKKGIMLCSPHLTTLELSGRIFAERTLPISVVYRPQKKALLEYITHSALEKHYQHVIPRNDIRGMVKTLKQNSIVWYAADVDAGTKNSVFVPFFGTLAATITATSRYAKMTGAAVIPAFFYRREQGDGYDVVLKPALTEFPSADVTNDAWRINQLFEEAVLHKPEQYLWQYKRFKTRPAGESRFYT